MLERQKPMTDESREKVKDESPMGGRLVEQEHGGALWRGPARNHRPGGRKKSDDRGSLRRLDDLAASFLAGGNGARGADPMTLLMRLAQIVEDEVSSGTELDGIRRRFLLAALGRDEPSGD